MFLHLKQNSASALSVTAFVLLRADVSSVGLAHSTGVAAGFNAPISGVFFAVETVLQAQGSDLRRNSADTTPGLTIAMVLLASVLAAIVSQAGLGMIPAVKVPDYQLQSIFELPLILLFGACCGLVSASFAYSNQVSITYSAQPT